MTHHTYPGSAVSTLFRSAALALLTAGLTSCMTYKEPPATADAVPPPGYAPRFVQTIAPLPQTLPGGLALSAGRADMSDPRTVRLLMHLVDTSGTYYYGGTLATFRSMWCLVTDTINGVATPVKNFTVREVTERERVPIAVAIVTDHSGSMGDARARAVQDAVRAFIARKNAEDALALVRYDHTTRIEAPLTADPTVLSSTLLTNGLEGMGGGTAIHSGIAAAIDHLDTAARSYARKAVLVFTDGQENSSKISRDTMISMAIAKGVSVCAVDFGAGINEGYMEGIARATGGSYQHIYGTAEFKPMFEDVYRRLKNAYILEYTPDDYGVHTVGVRFCHPKDSLEATFSFDNTPDIGTISLLNVNFDVNKATLTPESMRAVNNVVRLMRAFPKMTIELRGHTDSQNRTGDKDHNTKLSQKRSEAVRDAIVKAGIDGTRIKALGLGDTVPVAPNDTEEGRARNRRTEFIVLTR